MKTKEIFRQLFTFYNEASMKTKIIITSAIATVVIFTFFIIVYFNSNSIKTSNMNNGYSVLFENLSKQDSSSAVSELQANNVPFKVVDDGKILVKSESVYKERLALASKGIPKSSRAGYELFDKKDFGDTDFDKKVKFMRALEGELSRTIESINSVKKARVQIAMPKDTLFIERKKTPKVSVLITLKSGYKLVSKQVNAIKHLIASAIPDLVPNKVDIIDSDGVYLSGSQMADDRVNLELKYKRVHEKMYQKRIEDLIAPFLGGKDRVVAKVSIEYDFSKKAYTDEFYSPDNTIRSEENLEEKKTGLKRAIGGVPGVVSNIGPVQGLDDANKNKYYKKQNIYNYEISKKISTKKSEFARIKRITAAVMIDGKYQLIKNKLGAVTSFNYTKLPKDTIDSIINITKQAIGFNTKREDQVTVTNLEFESNRIKYERLIKGNQNVVTMILKYIQPFSYIVKYTLVLVMLYFIYRKIFVPIITSILEDKTEKIEVEDSYFEDEDTDNIIEKAKELRKKISGEIEDYSLDKIQVKFNLLLDKVIDTIELKPKEVAGIISSIVTNDGEE